MRSYAVLVSTILSSAVLAAPTPASGNAKSMMAAVPEWTIEGAKRVCDTDDTKCTWSFGINNGTGTTPCEEVVTGSPASQTNGGPATCGVSSLPNEIEQ